MLMLRNAVKSCLRLALGELSVIEISFKLGRSDKGAFYDRLAVLIMKRVLGENSTCIDVGCHAGAILEQMLRYAPKGTFLAFEPLPTYFRDLKLKFGERVRVFPYALGDQCRTTSFKFVETNPAYSGFRERQYPTEHERVIDIAVEERTLDSVIQSEKIDRIDFIKVDVEGAEILVFRGAKNAIQSSKPVIVFEHGLGAGVLYSRSEDMFRFFVECDMQVSSLIAFLKRRPPLNEASFCEQVSSGEFYFVAHPPEERQTTTARRQQLPGDQPSNRN